MVAEMTMISISKTAPSVTTVSEVKVSGAISSWRVAVPGLAGAAGGPAGGPKLPGGPQEPWGAAVVRAARVRVVNASAAFMLII